MVARPRIIGSTMRSGIFLSAVSGRQNLFGKTTASQRKHATAAARNQAWASPTECKEWACKAVEGTDPCQDRVRTCICCGFWWCGNRRQWRSPYGRRLSSRATLVDWALPAGQMQQQALGPGLCSGWWAGPRPVAIREAGGLLPGCLPARQYAGQLVRLLSRSWRRGEVQCLDAWETKRSDGNRFWPWLCLTSVYFLSNFNYFFEKKLVLFRTTLILI